MQQSKNKASQKGVLVAKLVAETSADTVKHLSDFNIVKYVRTASGMYVNFESRLTENVITEFEWVVWFLSPFVYLSSLLVEKLFVVAFKQVA